MTTEIFSSILAQQQHHIFRLAGENPNLVPQYTQFLETLWETNERYNLVSRRMQPEQLVLDHLLDCLLGMPHLPAAQKIADLGSGGGFPAVVIAIARPECKVYCYEKSAVKCLFLEEIATWLPNLNVMGPIPQGQHLGQAFDWITARAFKPIHVILELTRKHFQNGTPYWLYKGREEKIRTELEAAKLNQEQFRKIPLVTLGEMQERHLVVVGKKVNQNVK